MDSSFEQVLEKYPEKDIHLRGFTHVVLEQDGQIVGDSGWLQNQITDEGVRQYLAYALGAIGGSKQVVAVALGTGTVPGAAATTLDGEITGTSSGGRVTVTAASSGSTAVQFTATFSSSNSFVTATANISNIGLFNTSAYTSGTLFAGNTYGSSSCATNQNVNTRRHLTAMPDSKLRKLGGRLSEIIPNQHQANCLRARVETKDGALSLN